MSPSTFGNKACPRRRVCGWLSIQQKEVFSTRFKWRLGTPPNIPLYHPVHPIHPLYTQGWPGLGPTPRLSWCEWKLPCCYSSLPERPCHTVCQERALITAEAKFARPTASPYVKPIRSLTHDGYSSSKAECYIGKALKDYPQTCLHSAGLGRLQFGQPFQVKTCCGSQSPEALQIVSYKGLI